MATQQILAERRAKASAVIEQRVKGLARLFGISAPQLPDRAYPDAEHKQADADERIAAILTAVLRARDAKAPELRDVPAHVIYETITTYDDKGDSDVRHQTHTQPLRR